MQRLIRCFLNGGLGAPSPNSAATPATGRKKQSESDKPALDKDKCFEVSSESVRRARRQCNCQSAESRLDLFTEWDTLVEDMLVKDISKHYSKLKFITENKINHKRRSASKLSVCKRSDLKHALIMHELGTDLSYPVPQLENIERVTSIAHGLRSVCSTQRNMCMLVQGFEDVADQKADGVMIDPSTSLISIQLQPEPGDDQPKDWIKGEIKDSDSKKSPRQGEAEPEHKPKRKRCQRNENVKTRPAEQIDSPPDPHLPGHSL